MMCFVVRNAGVTREERTEVQSVGLHTPTSSRPKQQTRVLCECDTILTRLQSTISVDKEAIGDTSIAHVVLCVCV